MQRTKSAAARVCRLWKNDVEAAFTQLRFRPEFTHLLATRVDGDILFVYLCGVFGLTNMPMVFGVLSRALRRKIFTSIKGVAGAFVNDFVGFSVVEEATSDQNIAETIIRGTFNNTAVNESKSVRPTIELDVIGWTVKLEKSQICPNEKGINKLLFCFLFVDTNRHLPLKVYQSLASLAERYSDGLRAHKPFVMPLHTMPRVTRDTRANLP